MDESLLSCGDRSHLYVNTALQMFWDESMVMVGHCFLWKL